MFNVIFVWDTETTSFVKPALPLWHSEQPHLVQVGGVLLTDAGDEVLAFEHVVRPDGWVVPDAAAAVHGITTERALDEGIELDVVVDQFTAYLRRAETALVAFNLAFDSKVMSIARSRAGRGPYGGPERHVCAMNAATPVLNLPPTEKMLRYGFKVKRPSLREAHELLLGAGFDGAHSALADARAAGRVFMKLKELGHV